MRPYKKIIIFQLLFSFFFICSCVSNKKYEKQIELAGTYQDKYNALRHDSLLLAQRIDTLQRDSADTHKKLDELKKVKDPVPAPPVVIKYKPQTMAKDREMKLKVIYLYNIATGIQWQPKYAKGNFIIGVLGHSPLTAELTKEFANKKKGTQNFFIVEFDNIKDIYDCQLLFIAKGNYQNLAAARKKLKNYPTLLVSEEDYKAQGSHFNLAIDGDELRMSANRELLKKMSFSVSKTLLGSAE
jgi:hypothetical protein